MRDEPRLRHQRSVAPLIKEALARTLDEQPDLEAVAEAAGFEAVELCRRLQPDLVLMDGLVPGMDGLEATRRIKEGLLARSCWF